MIIISNIIIDGGIPSKNSPNYCKDSFLLACRKKNISGFKVDIYVTKDCKFVLANDQILKNLGINEEFIHSRNYEKIKNIKYGTKVKSHYLIDLETLFKICKSNFNIIINVCNKYLNEKEIECLNKLLIINNSKNLFVSSSSIDILNKLNNELNKGIFVTNKKDWEYSYLFYIVEEKNIDEKILYEKIKNNAMIFIICEKDSDIFNKYKNNNVFIISKYTNFILKKI